MLFKNMLPIPDGAQDTLFGFLAIIAVVVLVYAFGFSEIARRRVAKAREAKRLAVEGLNLLKMQEGFYEEMEDSSAEQDYADGYEGYDEEEDEEYYEE